MTSLLVSVAAFIVTIGVLVTIHEFGHFWVAKRLGVKVLRFSVGFGRPLWRRRGGADGTEYVIAAIPLGGYVKMLDEREIEVPAAERHRAFNRQSVGRRIAVVAAGPVFNFLFAIVAYALMFMIGVTGVRPVVGQVETDSLAAEAGFQAMDEIRAVDNTPVRTWEQASMTLLDEALEEGVVDVSVRTEDGSNVQRNLDLRDTRKVLAEGSLFDKLGIQPWRPTADMIVDRVAEGSAAAQAGLREGDRIVAADGRRLQDWQAWVDYVRQRPGEAIVLTVERGQGSLELSVRPEPVEEDGERIGRIGVYPKIDRQALDAMRVTVRYGPLESVGRGMEKMWDVSTLTLRVLWNLVLGQASVKTLSGPLSIAEYAGVSATIGMAAFLSFLALVSVSLGVLNLLPIPVLDGGHLLYYLIELAKGSPLSEEAQAVGQRIGLVLLAALMALVLYNDLTRLVGSP